MWNLLMLLVLVVAPACTKDPTAKGDESGAPTSDADASTLLPSWDEEIAIPQAKDLDASEHRVAFELTARIADVAIAGKTVSMWTYEGSVPGPTLRAREGDRVHVHFVNQLPEPTTIHWHGLEVPAAMDGSEAVQSPVMPGESFDYEFVVPHAGTYWYHPHFNSSAQLWNGLYGAFIVDDANEAFLGAETTIILDDVLLEQNGSLGSSESNGNLGDYFGREGTTMLVNGKELPTIRARAGEALRLRFLNASNSHYFMPAIEGHSLMQVGSDSGLLNKVQAIDALPLSPSERAEVVVFAKGKVGDVLTLISRPYPRYECGGLCWPTNDLLRIKIVEGAAPTFQLPKILSDIRPIDLTSATAQRLEIKDGSVGENAVIGFNGKVYPDALELHALVGDTQVWEIDNQTDYHHPFHLHGFRFQVLDVGGAAPRALAWKDSFNVPSRTKARIAVTFDDRPGMWMFHCHILDHAKIGMMGMLHVDRANHP